MLCLTRSASVEFLCAHTVLTPAEELAAHTLPGTFYLNWDRFPPTHQHLAEAAETFLQEPAVQRALSRLSLRFTESWGNTCANTNSHWINNPDTRCQQPPSPCGKCGALLKFLLADRNSAFYFILFSQGHCQGHHES